MANQLIANNEPIGGTAFVTVNGATFMLGASNVKWSVSNVERESKNGLSGTAGYQTKPRTGFIEFDFYDRGSQSVNDINGITSGSIVLELENGKVISGSSMWATTPVEVDQAEGTGHARFESGNVREDVAGD